MIKTAFLTPEKSDREIVTSDKTVIPKEKKHVTVSFPEIQRPPIRVHDIFLNLCRKECTYVEVVLKTGEIISGFIDSYDKDTIVVHNEIAQMLIYKHSIGYISPRNGQKIITAERRAN